MKFANAYNFHCEIVNMKISQYESNQIEIFDETFDDDKKRAFLTCDEAIKIWAI